MPEKMPSLPATPLTLIESRYWVMNARLAEPAPDHAKLISATNHFQGEILTAANFTIEIVRHPLDNYTEETHVLLVKPGREVIGRLNEKYCSAWKELQLTHIELYLTDLEILCCYAVFALDPSLKIKTLEEEGMGLVDLLSSLQPDLEAIFRLLEMNKIVICHSDLIFGVPVSLRKANLHTPDYSYLYNWHIFFQGNKEILDRTIADYELEKASFPYDGERVYPGWGMVLWDISGAHENTGELINRVFIDSLSGSESVMYDNAIFIYTGFLDLIIRNEKVDSNHVRQICNISHLVLQRIKLWKRNLSVEQQAYHEKQRAVMMLEQKKSDFDSSEDTLIKAVEGIEVKQSQKSGRIIELVLSFFTALSLYSVANDFYSIMITDGSVKPINLFSARTVLIFLATGIVLGFFYLLRKARRS
jgi:hypothetical protein